MQGDIIVSVIVPVYNRERTIRRAVDSVLCQMDGQIELVLVDDGSIDSSGAICDEYAERYPDVHVIHKPNGGTSSAKNKGIDIAKGMYISFLDSDDYLDSDTFSQIIPVLLEQKPDCLDFGLKYINAQGGSAEVLHQCKKNTLLSQQDLETLLLPPLLNLRKDEANFIFDFCANKIFRAEIIQKFQVRFDEEKRTWEDRTFLLRHLKHCQSYYAMDKCLYNYAYSPNSLSQQYNLDFFKIMLANFSHYRQLYEDRYDFDAQYANDYRIRAIENMIYRSLEQKENQEIIRGNIFETLRDERVVSWFTMWNPSDRTDCKIRILVIHGDCQKALEQYSKKAAQQKRKNSVRQFKGRMKRIMRKICGK